MTQELRVYNPKGPDAFTYGVTFIKANTGTEYDVNSLVDDLSVWESLFAKCMQAKLLCTDGSGLFDHIALQPGDKVRIVMFKGEENEFKMDKTFEIFSIQMGQQTINKLGKAYIISCLTEAGILNKVNVVGRALSGKLSDIATTVAKEYLNIQELTVEESDGEKKNLIMPQASPFKIMQRLADEAVSVEGGPDNSFYMFYEDRDGHNFKTLRQIITSDATLHVYTMTSDNSRTKDGKDLYRIISFQQNRIGSNASRLENGMVQNELLEFDLIGRRINSQKFDFSSDRARAIQLLGTQPLMDRDNNLQGLLRDTGKIRGALSALKIRSNEEAYDEVNTYQRKHNAVMAQKAMFNQLSYTFTMGGNCALKAGDLLEVEAASLNAMEERELDMFLNGRFLIGNVRHKVTATKEFITVVDVFKDGMETEYKPRDEK